MLLAWGVSAPVLLVAAGHLGLAVRPRAMLGGLAVALVAAGIVALGTLPLLAYLAVVPHAGEHTCVARALLASVLALAAGVVVPGRVLRALDGSARASWVAHLFSLVTVTLFLLRIATTAPALYIFSR